MTKAEAFRVAELKRLFRNSIKARLRMRVQLDAADLACGELAENAARDLAHGGYQHPKWYRAVKQYQKLRGSR